MKKAIIVLAIMLISATSYAYDTGQCLGECSMEQGECMGQCEGDAECMNRCAAAHGRCVARCHNNSF